MISSVKQRVRPFTPVVAATLWLAPVPALGAESSRASVVLPFAAALVFGLALLISWMIFWRLRNRWRTRLGELEREIASQICIERQLQASQSNLQTATESLGLGTWYWDIPADRISCSTEAQELCNLPANTIYSGLDFFASVHPDDQERVREAVLRARRERGPFHVEYRVAHPGPRVSWVAASGRALVDPSGDVTRMTGVLVDVTDRKILEEHLQHARKMEAVGRLAGGIAHDFNNVLGVISAYGELLLDDSDLPPSAGKRVQEIMDATARANALTRQLLAFSRKQVLTPKVLNLNDVILGLMSMMQRLVGEDVAVVSSLHSGLPPIEADRSQIEQMLLNFAANSRDAMSGGGRFELRTSRAVMTGDDSAVPPGEYISLEVIDNGCGMSAEVIEHIFEPFFTTKGVGRGTGLGLATVYGVVQQAGGHISVSSTLNQGTTFRVYLPAVRRTVSEELPQKRQHGKLTGTVLLVEDEDALRKVLAEFIESAGMRVHSAANASNAMELVNAGVSVDILLTDLVMPDTNGRTLARHVRQKLPAVRVIYMSGHTDDDLMRRDLLLEGLPYLQKPFSRADLVHMLQDTSVADDPTVSPASVQP